MAVYKVPQDVEAEDKLLGPFSFRQFIYLIIAALAGFLTYLLGRLFIVLGLLPLPITLFFLALALPLKKDQPMETYLTAIVHFLLKPRKRLWDPEGNVSLVEITALHTDDRPALKDFSGHEASERLRYLSRVVDTGGWATRGLTSPMDNLNLTDTVVAEAQSAEDILDNAGSVSQNFDSMINRSDEARKQAMIQTMQSTLQAAAQAPAAPLVSPQQLYGTPQAAPVAAPALPMVQPTPQATIKVSPAAQQEPLEHVAFNPYPSSIHQRVIAPTEDMTTPAPVAAPPVVTPAVTQTTALEQAQASSEEAVSPDIMRLATSKDLSISTIAREAERLQKKHLEEEEVVVSLR